MAVYPCWQVDFTAFSLFLQCRASTLALLPV
jgi:hypothetical protein